MKQFLTGSTTRQLIRECLAAVWVTNEGCVRPPQRFMVAVDFSELSHRVLNQAAHLTKSTAAILDIPHVVEMREVLSGFGVAHVSKVRDSYLGQHEGYLGRCRTSGANGFVLKGQEQDVLAAAVRAVHASNEFWSYPDSH